MRNTITLFAFILGFTLISTAQISEVKDINPGTANAAPTNFIEYNGMLIFRATDGTAGVELWKSDGTSSGTQLIKDIATGTTNSNPSAYTVFKNKLYFNATTGTSVTGSELYVTDGTEGGTTLVKDIREGTSSSNPQRLNVLGDSIILFAANDGITGVELYKTNGTAEGTAVVKDYPGTAGSISEIVIMNGIAYLSQIAGSGRELYRSNGTDVGSFIVKDINPGTGTGVNPELFASSKNVLYFAGNDGTTGTELWKSDGTEAGTVLVKEINPGTANGNPRRFVEVGTKIYMNAAGPEGIELWETDGTTAGTKLVSDINPGAGNSNPDRLVSALGSLFFFAQEDGTLYDFYKYDGTTLTKLTNVKVAANTVNTTYAEINGKLYFAVGGNLWMTDGTVAGTVLVSSTIVGSPNPSSITNITRVGNEIYFAGTLENGSELFKFRPTGPSSIKTEDLLDITLYPNPATNMVNIQGTISDNAIYTIFDLSGKVLTSGKVSGQIVPLSSQTSIQIVRITDQNKVYQSKVIRM